MFGYIKPLSDELKVREFELYKSFYCGLCKTMGKKISPFSRLTLNYDMVFLVLLRIALTKEPIENKCFRCKLKPTKKRNYIKSNDTLLYSSCASAILAYYKCIDDINDTKNILKKFFYMTLSLFFSHMKKKACKFFSGLDDIIYKPLSKLNALEKKRCESIDKTASCFAELMQNIMCFGLESEEQIRIARQIGWHLGRWLYIIDALDDYKKDIKKKEYNPFIEYYNKNNESDISADAETIKYSLTSSLHEVSIAFCLAGNSYVTPVIENIISLGMCEQQETVLKQLKNKIGR
ncbi:MAG: DUF5685 family protein [Oscillospiraceae bacterium]|nr:DUF5685 family protein [Oscillospiraceae bacterium]